MCCGCTATYPAKPALVSPANNSTVPTGSVLLDWNSVSFGTGCPENTNKYQVYLDQNATPTTLKKDNLAASETSWSVSGLTAGTKYYWFIRASNGTRSTDSNIWSFTSGQPSCTVDLTPNPTSISEGATRTFTATVVPSNGTIDDVRFSSSNTSIATVSPATDGSSPYTTTATGVTDGSATITARVYMGGVQKCSDTATLTVTDPNPWWQVVDADVLTFGNLISLIPSASGEEFILPGAGGFPGIGIYGGTIADFSSGTGTGTVSSTGWLAKTSPISQKTFNYDYFEGIIPADITFNEITSSAIAGNALSVGGVSSRGYYWYRFDGTKGSTQNQDLTITSNVNLGGRKVVLLVKGANLNIEGRITVTDGSGTFVTMVGKNASGGKGDISIDAAVGAGAGPDLEGMYFADSQFKTGAGATQLNVRGAVAAYDGLVLERDLADNSVTPAEVFEYALDQVLLYPSSLSVRKIRWKEVAP
ncbi:Ig-like domain-containing protein [Candidatus Woesebacteria bacterium]|nr:Ig-like domain-containing protein [Candidatus Woesebacteria bacterium]